MFALFRSRWLLLTIVVPLAAWALDRVAIRVEQRAGENNVTRAMRWPRAQRRRRAAA